MVLIAMVILQYGSFFQENSHGGVFDSVADANTATFLDSGLSASQICLGSVMLAGAGGHA